jgi:hypothetical protein
MTRRDWTSLRAVGHIADIEERGHLSSVKSVRRTYIVPREVKA